MMDDLISRQDAIDEAEEWIKTYNSGRGGQREQDAIKHVISGIKKLPSVQPDENKYEYHYDHTDCIWYRPEARNRCPVTCAQYRDGWNDAMNYIFRDGKGYKPYRRDKQYGE